MPPGEMTLGTANFRAQPKPIELKADRFEALVCAHEAFRAGRPGGRRASIAFIVAVGFNAEKRNLADARFDGADFTGTSFAGADLSRASLYGANLSRCDLRGARLERADLRGCTLNGANLGGANLDGADMRAAVLWARDEVRGIRQVGGRIDAPGGEGVAHSVDFTNCSLQGASLRDANLKNANFQGANLNGADLAGAKVEGARFRGAILTGVDLEKLRIPAAELEECVLSPTPQACARVAEIERELDRAQNWISTGGRPAQLDHMDLRPAGELFRGRLLAGLQARGAMAVGVDFSRTHLHGANFEGADLRGADFTGADLRGACFVGANLAHAVFAEALIGELELKPGLTLRTRFDRAVLDGVTLPEPTGAGGAP